MVLSRNGKVVQFYESIYSGKKIIIGIDSSKSNTAIVVENEYGEELDDFEISGAGAEVNVYQLAWDTRKALKQLFMNADIIGVGLEDIITKKEDGYKGIEVHQSRAKITCVFDNIIFFFQEYHGIMPILINNWDWKVSELPEEFRKREHKKGSKDWFDSLGGRWANRKDDVTDAVCICRYTRKLLNIKPIYKIETPMAADKEYKYAYYPISTKMPQHSKLFEMNESISLMQNIETITHSLGMNEVGYMVLNINQVPIEEIYSSKMQRKYERRTAEILCVIRLSKKED